MNQNVLLQQNLDILTILIKHWLIVLEQIEIIQSDLENLPIELDILQRQLELLELSQKSLQPNSLSGTIESFAKNKKISTASNDYRKQHYLNTSSSFSQHQQIYSRIDILLKSFDRSLVHWSALEEKIGDLIALREIIEVLQERIGDRLSTDLTKHSSKNSYSVIPQSNPPQSKVSPDTTLRTYILKLRNFTSSKFGISLIVIGLFLTWGVTNYLFYQARLNKNQDNQINQVENQQSNLN